MQTANQHLRLPSRQVLSGAREVYDLFSLALKKPKEFELFMTATAECHDLKDAMRPKIEAMETEAAEAATKLLEDAGVQADEAIRAANSDADAALAEALATAKKTRDKADDVAERTRKLADETVFRAQAIEERETELESLVFEADAARDDAEQAQTEARAKNADADARLQSIVDAAKKAGA